MAEEFENVRRELAQLQQRFRQCATPPTQEELLSLTELLEKSLAAIEASQSSAASQARKLLERHDHLDRRLLGIENSRFFQTLRFPGRVLLDWKGRLGQVLLRSPLHPLYLKVFRPHRARSQYQLWLEREREATPSREWHQERARAFPRQLRFSIVMPVHQPRREWLEAAVESVRRQSFERWQLCVCDDASSDPWVAEYFRAQAAGDPRIAFVRSEDRVGIAGASNRAGELAHGDYVGFLDQDDVLSPYALHYVAGALQGGDADLVYSDEDRLDSSGRRVDPLFRPAWSPDLLLACMYCTHFLVARRQALDRAGWFRRDFEGSQDYDLVLRLTEREPGVLHVPRVLYHWRMHAGSTASSAGAKPESHEAGKRALADAVGRRGWKAAVADGPVRNSYRVEWGCARQPKVSIIVCSREARWLRRSVRALERRTAYPHRELVVVEHRTPENQVAMEKVLRPLACVRVRFEGAFDFAAMNNLGARQAGGEILVFLNDDIEPLDAGWLGTLVAQLERPAVGIVGARLLYRSGAIQHAGLTVGIMEGVGHLHRDTFGAEFWKWMPFARNVSAVTGACLAIRRSLFEELGGFDRAFPVNFNDADLCLRARALGHEVVYEPAAVLRHYECGTRTPGILYEERERWQERWGHLLRRGDPYYNPNLTRSREDASLRMENLSL